MTTMSRWTSAMMVMAMFGSSVAAAQEPAPTVEPAPTLATRMPEQTTAGLAAMGLGAVIGEAELLRSRGALERPVLAPMVGAGTTGLTLSSRF